MASASGHVVLILNVMARFQEQETALLVADLQALSYLHAILSPAAVLELYAVLV